MAAGVTPCVVCVTDTLPLCPLSCIRCMCCCVRVQDPQTVSKRPSQHMCSCTCWTKSTRTARSSHPQLHQGALAAAPAAAALARQGKQPKQAAVVAAAAAAALQLCWRHPAARQQMQLQPLLTAAVVLPGSGAGGAAAVVAALGIAATAGARRRGQCSSRTRNLLAPRWCVRRGTSLPLLCPGGRTLALTTTGACWSAVSVQWTACTVTSAGRLRSRAGSCSRRCSTPRSRACCA